jgi:hypothetical protein
MGDNPRIAQTEIEDKMDKLLLLVLAILIAYGIAVSKFAEIVFNSARGLF